MHKDTVLIAMTESDAHVVAIRLLQVFLEENGYQVINLGACVPLTEVVETASKLKPICIVLGAQNGHALDDIAPLLPLMQKRAFSCPVLLGGNVSIGSKKSNDSIEKLKTAGVTEIFSSFEDLLDFIEQLNVQEELHYA